ncbi:MAG: glycosyltransferase [Deltaproteobacteria bacterium]|nr:glycosyltransferase [Deltaproteobacteria bacterium]
MRVAILHPDLGIGGAERLVVDVALGLRAYGHQAVIHTARHDPAHAFAATCDGRVDVRVHGRWLPLHIGGALRAPAAVARMLAVARGALGEPCDALFCDVLSHYLPLLRRVAKRPIVFYGHYPDLLLTPPRVPRWYRAYRRPLDRWEESGLLAADRVLVNSAFTAAAFDRAFPRLGGPPPVMHPSVALPPRGAPPPSQCTLLLSLSRLVPGKNHRLALEAFAQLCAQLPAERAAAQRLVIAGGYDPRLPEAVRYVAELEARATALGLRPQVRIRRSPSDAECQALYASARAVLFASTNEHFGYVPLEAMAMERPVIAPDSGGPRETVRDGETGFLCAPTPQAFAAAARRLVEDGTFADRLGAAGRQRVAQHFSFDRFAAQLDTLLRSLRPD